MEFIIYTDGGCSGNKRGANCPGGYGYIIIDAGNNILRRGGGYRINVTNNQMELMAVIQGMRALKKLLDREYGGAKNHSCLIRPDSKYISDNYEEYLPTWKRNGWRKSNRKPVLNVALWKKLDALTPEFKAFKFSWVKGHARSKFNNMADGIAQNKIKEAKESIINSV